MIEVLIPTGPLEVEGRSGDQALQRAAARLTNRLGGLRHSLLILEVTTTISASVLVNWHGASCYHDRAASVKSYLLDVWRSRYI